MEDIYLSKAEVSYETVHKAGIRNIYDWHQKAWMCFPNRHGQKRDFLIRIDDTNQGFRLLVISTEKPSKPDWCPDGSWKTKKITEDFFEADHYDFSLLANPTFKTNGHRGTKKRVPILMENDTLDGQTMHPGLLSWIRRKGEQNGFVIDEKTLQIRRGRRQEFQAKGIAGCFSSVEFVGTLKVSDGNLFKNVVRRGIGTGKAFGFGMLCLARRMDGQA
ncbi:MAG: type I-E CRISPR-associated protein Cas6/Cse3/CasE [Terrimicrobiaceae bacterium]